MLGEEASRPSCHQVTLLKLDSQVGEYGWQNPKLPTGGIIFNTGWPNNGRPWQTRGDGCLAKSKPPPGGTLSKRGLPNDDSLEETAAYVQLMLSTGGTSVDPAMLYSQCIFSPFISL